MDHKVGGFRQTAQHFAIRAEKARDVQTKLRCQDAAYFYFKLSEIVVRFPDECVPPAPTGDRLRDRAEMCRSLAEVRPEVREKLLDLALYYGGK